MASKSYTLEFKREAVRLVSEKGYSQIEAARNLGIPKSCIQRWIMNEKGITVSHKAKTILNNLSKMNLIYYEKMLNGSS